jgi:hypothetical protein
MRRDVGLAAVAPAGPDRYILQRQDWGRESAPNNGWTRSMRAEIQSIVDEIKQSVGLLRRHL